MFNSHHAISRRAILSACALAPLVPPALSAKERLAKSSLPFVLVHGAWHGGWCWKKLIPLLRGAGREVFAPTLTGLGERSHLLSREVDLNTHIRDIAAVFENEDLNKVILVGHSYAGMVISGVAQKLGDRLAHLVYLDAFLPENGKALSDYAPAPSTRSDGWRAPSPFSPQDLGITNEEDIAWVKSRLGDQPLGTFTQPVDLISASHTPATFIQCSKAPPFAKAATRAKELGFQYHDLLSAGHDAMITRPNELAAILLDI